ncbi:MAG: CYTH and CHAD domain-containing protein [Kineosporiaceae bacterium]
MATHVEIELKFDVDAAFALPDLLPLPEVDTLEQPKEQVLQATYFDALDLRLLRGRITLRRRTGGGDEGWHLKLPAAGRARLEVHRPLGRATRTVPPALVELVEPRVRGAALAPVVTMTTHRTVHRLLGPGGVELAEVADDTVTAEVLPSGPGEALEISTWREIELELIDGDEALLEAASALLLRAGARPAGVGSKLARALGSRLTPEAPAGGQATSEVVPEKDGKAKAGKAKASKAKTGKGKRGKAKAGKAKERPQPAPVPTAGSVAAAYLSGQARDLLVWDPHVRVDTDDAVHRMRVAARRMRSALATFKPFVDAEALAPLREELRWLGGVLGTARDAEVLHDRLVARARALSPDLLLGPVVARLDAELRQAYRDAHEGALRELRGARYFALVEQLEALLLQVPAGADAALPVAALGPRVRKAVRRMEAAVASAREAVTALASAQEAAAGAAVDSLAVALAGQHRDEALHEVRKAAKRVRYAAEAVADVVGSDATRLANAAEQAQELLGDHQDGVVAAAVLRETAVRAHLAGENAFSYGVLLGRDALGWEAVPGEPDPTSMLIDAAWHGVRRAAKGWPGR